MTGLSSPGSSQPEGGPRPILVVVPMPPSYRGGTEEYAYQVARWYSGERPVRILTSSVRWNDGKNALGIGGAQLERIPALEMMERPVVFRPGAHRLLREEVRRASVVQLHMPFPWVERYVTGWARRFRVPSVLTYHMDAEFGAKPNAWRARFVTESYRVISAVPALRRCDAVVSNSLGYARASPVLSRFLPKVRVIPQGIDTDRLRSTGTADSLPAYPRIPGVQRIVFVGRIVPYKGLIDLVEAVRLVRSRGKAVELLIGGKGPQRSELEARVRAARLTGVVRFLGFVPDAEVGGLYAGADAVACPSVSLLESTPISLQEAMAFGTPVVGTMLPGTEETVPNDGARGRLVPPRNPEALALALIELLDHGRNSPEQSVRGWKETARDYLKLFDELEGRSGSR